MYRGGSSGATTGRYPVKAVEREREREVVGRCDCRLFGFLGVCHSSVQHATLESHAHAQEKD